MCFEVGWVCSFQELLALNRLAGKTTRRWHSRLLRGILLLTSISGLMLSVLLLTTGFFDLEDVPLVVISVLLLLLGIVHHHINAWMSRRMMVRGSDRMQYSFDEEGIRVVTDTANLEHPYSAVWAIYRFRGRIFVFLDKKHSYIIPEHGFSQGSAETLLPFLQTKCGVEVKTVR